MHKITQSSAQSTVIRKCDRIDYGLHKQTKCTCWGKSEKKKTFPNEFKAKLFNFEKDLSQKLEINPIGHRQQLRRFLVLREVSHCS